MTCRLLRIEEEFICTRSHRLRREFSLASQDTEEKVIVFSVPYLNYQVFHVSCVRGSCFDERQ